MSYPEAQFIRLAWFPITIHKDGELVIQEGKIFVTDSHVLVFNNSKEAIISEPLQALEGSMSRGYTVITTENTYQAVNSVGCGCGSRLRSFNPYRGVAHISQL